MLQTALQGARAELIINIEQEELRGISRTVAEIEWLLLIMVLLYMTFGSSPDEVEPALSSAMFFYAAFVMSFRYANFYKQESRWKIAIETWAMLVFITWAVWFTGRLASPLLSAYLLAIITSALTLGKTITLLETAVVAACYVMLGAQGSPQAVASLPFVGGFAAHLAPVVLVAYVTTLFSSDIRYGLNRAKLLSETDELTGLYNMRGFAIAAGRLFGQALRHDRPASLLMIDADNLKSVNDSFGHDVGNELIRHIARSIHGQLRFTDVAARFGGDEFVVLLPETPARNAVEVAERIRKVIAEAPRGAKFVTSASIGVAGFPEDGRSLDTILARADRAVYQAKAGGRNCVVRHAVERA
jgi:diguanylate cyclase (GGDEF)-like protein